LARAAMTPCAPRATHARNRKITARTNRLRYTRRSDRPGDGSYEASARAESAAGCSRSATSRADARGSTAHRTCGLCKERQRALVELQRRAAAGVAEGRPGVAQRIRRRGAASDASWRAKKPATSLTLSDVEFASAGGSTTLTVGPAAIEALVDALAALLVPQERLRLTGDGSPSDSTTRAS
jgi:hypothetical protein